MKRSGIVLLGLLIVVLGTVNCGDDCVECPPADTGPSLHAFGEISIPQTDRVKVSIEVLNIAGNNDKVESAYLDDDQLCVRTLPHTAAGDGRQIIRWIGQDEWCPSGVLPGFTPTDTTTVTLFCNGVEHTAYLHLLNDTGDMPDILTAEAYQNGTLFIDWTGVPDAEWYSIRIHTQSNFSPANIWNYYRTDTTSITVTLPFGYAQILEIEVYVAAGCGPVADDSGFEHNMSGPHIFGSIYSVSNNAYQYLLVNPLSSDRGNATGEHIEPPSIPEILRMQRERFK